MGHVGVDCDWLMGLETEVGTHGTTATNNAGSPTGPHGGQVWIDLFPAGD